MKEIFTILLGTAVLALGIPIGNFLAKYTKDELQKGQIWFKAIILLSFVGAVLGLVFREDSVLFTFLFIAIVTSRSLKR